MIELYSFGYKDNCFSPFAEKLRENKFDAVIDTRFNPNCYDAFWQKKALGIGLPLYGVEYFHFKELGNENYYDSDKPIKIKDIVNGEIRLSNILKAKSFNKICLLCTCMNIDTCHNSIVIKELEKDKNYSYKDRL